MRICTKDTEFTVKEVLATDIGILSCLPKVVGKGRWGKDLCLTARIFSAEEAKQVDLMSKETVR